jgi:hypothetical protein
VAVSWQAVRRLALAVAILAIVSAVMTVIYTLALPPLPPPPPEVDDLVAQLESFQAIDQQLFPWTFVQSVVTIALFLCAALLGMLLRRWANASALRDAMVLLFVVGGVLGIAGNVLNIAASSLAAGGYCDCGYKNEELIALNYASRLGWDAANWLVIAALTLLSFGVASAGRLVAVSSLWRTVSYAIAGLILLAAAIRAVASFVFISAFDPFQVSDLLTAVAAGILVPIWAILLARGLPRSTEMAA